jgi:phage tail protein X
MKLFGHEVRGYAKTLVILVAVLLASSGLCGLQLVMLRHGSAISRPDGLLISLGIAELIAMFLSAGGIVVVLILWATQALYARLVRPSKAGTGKHFEDSDNSSHRD